MPAPLQCITVQVPASTSNLGSGFDTLGLAVGLYNRLTVRRRPGIRVTLAWPADPVDRDWFHTALNAAADRFFAHTGRRPLGVEVILSGEVPVARGLGASATIRVGLLAALNELTGGGVSRDELLAMATALEGHPDNASPAIFGGFTISGHVGRGRSSTIRCLSFPVASRLKLVTLMPRVGISTEKARRLLPARYPRADTVHALNRAALITAALSSGRYDALEGLFDDRVHQPYRECLLPELSRVIRAGVRAGALGGFLSGSGSSIMCLSLRRPRAVAVAMQKVMPEARVCILTADNLGLRVIPTGGASRSP